jgi:hypothetical protein
MISVEQSSNNQNQSYQIKTNSKSSNIDHRRKSSRKNDIGIFKKTKFGFL